MKRAIEPVQKSAPNPPLKEAFVDLTGEDYSFWLALVWRFRHTNPAQLVINFGWKFSLPSGGMSTDPEHEVLLESFKTVLWGMLTNDEYGRSLSVGTLMPMSGGIREAFRWFVWNGIRDFSQLSPKFLSTYLDALPQLIVDKEGVYAGFKAEGYNFGHHSPSIRRGKAAQYGDEGEGDEEGLADRAAGDEVGSPERQAAGIGEEGDSKALVSEDVEDEDDGVSYSQVSNRVAVLYYIHAQSKLLERRNLPVLLDKPFRGKTFGEVSSSITPHVINRIPALPQAVSQPLLTEVFRWVDHIGALVGSVHRSFHSARNGDASLLEGALGELDAAGFTVSRFALLPWRERIEKRVEGLDEAIIIGRHRVRLATLLYRDACVLALQYLAGLRISEVCSVMVARDKVDGLPSCLYKRVSPDGMTDLYFLKAMLVKGRPRPNAKDWVIGCVPCGSEQVPVLVRALDQLHDVIAPFFYGDEEMPLFLHYANRWGMPRSKDSLVQASGVDLQRGCRRFIRCFVDLSKLPDYDSFGNSLVRYRESEGECIRTHQGRKTFADYCLKTRKSSLSALSFHYGHLNESITYKGYYEPIQRLADEVESMAHSATVDFFVSRSERRTVFGNMAEAVDRFLAENKLDSIKDITVLRIKVKEVVLAHDLRIFFNDFGNCFISVAPLESRCQQAAGGASWMLRKPNYMTRNITMCAGCNCFALDSTHLPYWERRAEDWSSAAKDPTNRVAVNRHLQSLAVVRLFKKMR